MPTVDEPTRRQSYPEKTNQTEQYVLNYSFDEIFKLLIVGLAGYNTTTGNYDRLTVDSDGALKTTASVTVGDISVAAVPDATNTYGASTSVANGASQTLVNIASSAAGYKVSGLTATGTGDGYYFIQVGGTTILSGRTSVSQKTLNLSLPNPIPISTGTAVTLKVTNESGSTADFEATLLGV